MTTGEAKIKIQEATDFLVTRDDVLNRIYQEIGLCTIRPSNSYFINLTRSIISQQLSVKAAGTIFGRFERLLQDNITPNSVGQYAIDDFRAIGVSGKKASFILGLATEFVENPIYWSDMSKMSNQEIKIQLCQVKGIGEWTAEMFSIFTLFKLDVLPLGDVGLQNAIQYFYQLDSKPSAEQIKSIAKSWGDYSSVASWYLWKGFDEKI